MHYRAKQQVATDVLKRHSTQTNTFSKSVRIELLAGRYTKVSFSKER